MDKIKLSSLGHTWILDLDGTILKHNGYIIDGFDSLLPGVKEFLEKLPKEDILVFITARQRKYQKITEDFLRKNGIRYTAILYDAPHGERIVVNDNKPGGLHTAKAVNVERDTAWGLEIETDYSI